VYRPIGIALLVIGVVLLVFGISASDSIGSDLSRLFRGTPTDRSIWLVVVGAASAIVGLLMTLSPKRGTRPL
jgi:protein-S-isoprenylcysteine O-methyltransferase Ste14